MKSPRRRPIQKAEETPKDLATHFRELQELEVKVSEAELAVAQKTTANVKTKVDESGRPPRKPTGRGRTH
jgi:hypothetical protein